MESRCHCGQNCLQIHSHDVQTINCHCGMCRGLSGGAFTTWAMAPAEAVQWPEKTAHHAEYAATDNVTLYFCKTCATTFAAIDKRYQQFVAFKAGTLSGGAIPPPLKEYFFDHKAIWFAPGLHTEKFGGSEGTEPLA